MTTEYRSKAQLKQDLFVIQETQGKTNGYFVEFGATNGIDINNTYLLETELGWTGILAEPAKCWHADLARNRPNSIVDFRCVWRESNQFLLFNEVDPRQPGYSNASELSTIDEFSSCDSHAAVRQKDNSVKYTVETVSLKDLLDSHNAPRVIDYLSIDTEGSEYEILSNFDFDSYDIRIITCEHNCTPMREKIYDLLISKGYTRKFTDLSQWDDWYVKS